MPLPNGGQYVIGFTKHAINRMYDRTTYCPNSYGAQFDVFAILHDLIAVEANSNEGFYLWVPCKDNFLCEYLCSLLYDKKPGPNTCFREGYCPIDLQGKFAVAKTLLSPAMCVEGVDADLVTYRNLCAENVKAIDEFAKLNSIQPQFGEADRALYSFKTARF